MRKSISIEDHGIIGNLHTTALVTKEGSIDFLPFTRFDSPTIFGTLLDDDRGGYWQITPDAQDFKVKQQYLPDTAVLLTRFYTEEGIAELTDFMPVHEEEHECAVVRTIKIIKGKFTLHMKCRPRLNYARTQHEIFQENETTYLIKEVKEESGQQIRFISNMELVVDNNDLTGRWTLEQGQIASFVIEAIPRDESCCDKELEHFTEHSFRETTNFWRDWVDSSTYQGRWREMIIRSAITLKLLTSIKYGSTIAAATFSLPESMHGQRNWDYRYTWIRDSAFTMYAFIRLGFLEDAHKYIRWIFERCKQIEKASDLQLMYAVDGSSEGLEEKVLDHLEGYRAASPVRIGNAAINQLQMDIYGELIDTIYLFNKYGGPITFRFWQSVAKFVDFVANNWEKADHGIWEVRGEKREYLYSKVMAWVALDRGILIAKDRSFPAPLERWEKIRDEVYNDVYFNFWNEDLQSFVQYRGADTVDAAALLIPLVRMFSPLEPRWQSTLKCIEKHLVTDSLVYRFKSKDGTGGIPETHEATFSICSFWYVENLSKAGDVDKARLYFEKMLSYANHLGLYSEEISLKGEQLGNFPQAFTHLALISAAFELNRDFSAPMSQQAKNMYV
jgi:GH15 family glucan-1,4-alpha-glucosidase